MKKTNTKKTLAIENKDIILEDYVDAKGEEMFKKAAETGLGAFKNLGKQIWSSTVQYGWDVAHGYYVEDKSLKNALRGASRSLDRRYLAYSRELDSIFNASGVAGDVNMAINLTFLPARGIDWYIGNEKLMNFKNNALKDQGAPLWNAWADERKKEGKKWPPDWMRFDLDTSRRNSSTENEILVRLFNLYVLLSNITNKKSYNEYTDYKKLVDDLGGKEKVINQIDSVRSSSSDSENSEKILKCLFYLTWNTALSSNSTSKSCLKVLYGTKSDDSLELKYHRISNVVKELSAYPTNDMLHSLEEAIKLLKSETLDAKYLNKAEAYYDGNKDKINESLKNAHASLIIFNKDIKLLLKEENKDETKEAPALDRDWSKQEENTTPQDVKAFASLMEKIASESNDAVKQDIILWNLSKDMSYFNACITAYTNLENIYVEIIEAFKDVNKSPQDVGSIIKQIVEKINTSFEEKKKFYETCLANQPQKDLLPDDIGNIVINENTNTLPTFSFNSSKLITDLSENYDLNKFKQEAKNPQDDAIVLYQLPSNYLSNEAQLDKFLNDDRAVKILLNLYCRKHLVDSLLTGDNNLDNNLEEIDKLLNVMSGVLDKLSSDQSVNLQDLIAKAQSSKQDVIKNRVDVYRKALSSLSSTVDVVGKMEERAKSLEPLSKDIIDGIEKLFSQFNDNSEDQSEEKQDQTKISSTEETAEETDASSEAQSSQEQTSAEEQK